MSLSLRTMLGLLATVGVVMLVLLPSTTGAQELAPGARYDPAIPILEATIGHDHGDEITTPEQVGRYLEALAAAAPDRFALVEYAHSWEGRPLHLGIVASPERIARLEALTTNLRRLADPGALVDDEAERLITTLPVVIWLLHGVHGNEISSTDAALAELYHLLASQGDEAVDTILREAVVLVDPMQNPDGRARFIYQHLLGRAATPDPEPASAEHDEPWPGGRTNHYLFDMNRDWFGQTQPETRGRVSLFLEWFPHVMVDLHEMGGNSTYFFAPPTRPLAGDLLRRIKDWIRGGGTLITLGEASRWAAREAIELLETRTELRDGSPEATGEEDEDDDGRAASRDPDEPFDLDRAIAPDRERPELVPGSLLNVTLDLDHWLSVGTDGAIHAIVEGRRVFTPIKLDKGVNVGVYAKQDELVSSGLAWEESQVQLAQKAFLIHQPMGRGHLVAFAEDPNFRGFAEMTQLLFMNAVLLGPGH